jgi:hypothetical protein
VSKYSNDPSRRPTMVVSQHPTKPLTIVDGPFCPTNTVFRLNQPILRANPRTGNRKFDCCHVPQPKANTSGSSSCTPTDTR